MIKINGKLIGTKQLNSSKLFVFVASDFCMHQWNFFRKKNWDDFLFQEKKFGMIFYFKKKIETIFYFKKKNRNDFLFQEKKLDDFFFQEKIGTFSFRRKLETHCGGAWRCGISSGGTNAVVTAIVGSGVCIILCCTIGHGHYGHAEIDS